jgi:hypothetical protein
MQRLRLAPGRGIGRAVHLDGASRGGALATEDLEQFLLAIAGHAGDANDLMRAHLQEGHIQPRPSDILCGAQALDRQAHCRLGHTAALWTIRRVRFADHHRRHIPRRQLGGNAAPGHLAAAQHGDLVGEAHDVGQLMGDDHYSNGAAVCQALHQAQHLLRFLRGKHGCRLVQHEKAPLQI